MLTDFPTKVVGRGEAASESEGLAARLADEMVLCWHTGERALAEEFFASHPELLQEPEAAIRLIYEEICLREEFGEAVSAEDIVCRFPQWQAQLRVLLDCHHLLDTPTVPVLPAVKESVGEFFLLAELGRGVQGRVYLASQSNLGDRLVVLKITPRTGQEHLALARLQHTHIVPLYAVHDDAGRNLRTLCMPYFGGAAFNRVLAELETIPTSRRTGQDLLDALDRAAATVPTQDVKAVAGDCVARAVGPARQLLAGVSYVQAVTWIGACLADALQYAHERGLIHLDLKPNNVLLAADGEPMLLDFHVAQKPIRPGGPVPEWLGGTPCYMSPEQQAALTAMKQGKAITAVVDGRSDIFSLGLLLYEVLGGKFPLAGQGAMPPLSRFDPQVSVGLSDIVGKCLAADPQDRYPTAAALASDLRRHLGDWPLKGVANRSLGERWSKWRRRRPHALALTVMGFAVLAAALALGFIAYERGDQRHAAAARALQEGQDHLKNRSYAKAVDALTRGLAGANDLPDGGGALGRELAAQMKVARRAWLAEQLHALVDRLRFLYGASTLPKGEARPLGVRWREVWDKRRFLRDPDGAKLEPDLEQRLDMDLLDLGIIWADLCVRLAEPSKADDARREALQVLADTEEQHGNSYVLSVLRQQYALELGQTSLDDARRPELAPQTAWEHYALGRSLLQSGDLGRAAAALDQAVALQPNGFWPNFYQGVCAYRQKRYADAGAAFRVCIALAPNSAECYHNRALAEAGLGQDERALADYDRALQLDPKLAAAALNRGLLHLAHKRYGPARADLQVALRLGVEAAPIHYNLALISLEQHDRPAAIASLQSALDIDPDHQAARALLERLRR